MDSVSNSSAFLFKDTVLFLRRKISLICKKLTNYQLVMVLLTGNKKVAPTEPLLTNYVVL